MTNEQINKMYEIKHYIEESRRMLDRLCFYSGENNLQGEDYQLARNIHSNICKTLDLF